MIDEDYRGNVGVILFNHGDKDFDIKAGDRVAQLILERIAIADVEEVSSLDETARGEGGFGSTGVKKMRVEGDAATGASNAVVTSVPAASEAKSN